MSGENLHGKIAEISDLMAKKLRVRGRDLDRQIRKGGRLLPRHIRAEARFLAEAAVMVQNPKLARMIDETRVNTAYRNVSAYLNGIDRGEIIKGRILGILGTISAALIVIFIVVVWLLVQRGLV